jgi:hypothetical protein
MPLEYANTIANKATCLWGLPDDPEDPRSGHTGNLRQAHALLLEAEGIFAEHGEAMKADSVRRARAEMEAELQAAPVPRPH